MVTWNCRSLWANEGSETMQFAFKLAHPHDITVLTETWENAERLAFLKGKLLAGLKLFSSGCNQYKGGIAIIVRDSFMKQFTYPPAWEVYVEGRVAKLTLRGPSGTLSVHAVYLSQTTQKSETCKSDAS